jgi:hypothetical protein
MCAVYNAYEHIKVKIFRCMNVYCIKLNTHTVCTRMYSQVDCIIGGTWYIYIHRTPQYTHSHNGIDDEVHWCVCVYCICKYMQMVKYKTMYICVCQTFASMCVKLMLMVIVIITLTVDSWQLAVDSGQLTVDR